MSENHRPDRARSRTSVLGSRAELSAPVGSRAQRRASTTRHALTWPLALTFCLLSGASLASAQQSAPPYQAPPPASQGEYQAAPPPQAGDYQAAPPNGAPAQQPQQGYATPPPPPSQPYYQGQPQGQPQGYPPPPPGAYPAQQPYPGQPYAAPTTVGWRPPARPRRGMMIAGVSIFAGSYLLSMVVGSALIDNNNSHDSSCHNCRQVGRWLFVPLVGPFAAMGPARDGNAGLFLLGMVEVVGAGLMTAGIIVYRNSRRALDAQGYSWDLGNNRKLSLNLDTGVRSVGPRMRLDF